LTVQGRTESEEIDAIASELNHLSVSRGDTEAFLVRRDELVLRLRRLARKLTRAPEGDEPLTTWRTYPKPRAGTLLSDGGARRAGAETVAVRTRR
jgi:hypothetical protein